VPVREHETNLLDGKPAIPNARQILGQEIRKLNINHDIIIREVRRHFSSPLCIVPVDIRTLILVSCLKRLYKLKLSQSVAGNDC